MERVMADRGGYGQFCPVAMAAEIVCSRWTALVIRELLCGSTHFNELRRGVPRMSPTLLSKRLKELAEAGVVAVVKDERGGVAAYHLTEAGEELRPIIMALGDWGQRWVESDLSLRNLDPSLLMWDMRRMLDPKPLPKRRCTIRFEFAEPAAARQLHWLVVDPQGKVDLCSVDPGFDVDLFVTGSLKALTSVWMGLSTVESEVARGKLELTGERDIARSMQQWLGLSSFARAKPQRPAATGAAA
jgi:DNA-binding HxlR family transcriptional regulator